MNVLLDRNGRIPVERFAKSFNKRNDLTGKILLWKKIHS